MVQRSKAAIFNKAQQPQVEEIRNPIFTPTADGSSIMGANGCQVWVTHASMAQILTNIYVNGTQGWPDSLTFKNNDGSPPWGCPFSFQQREEYVLANGAYAT